MDYRRLDQFARTLAVMRPRRTVAVALAGGILAALRDGSGHEASAKKRKKKKKKPPACARNCNGKDCGDADGCGAGETCINGQCIGDACDPPCTGNHICKNGSCACPQGLKECEGPGYFGNCHECCSDGHTTSPHPDCAGHLGGQYCSDFDGDLVETCGCGPQENCGDGICVQCCTNQLCRERYNDDFRVCIGGGCRCEETAGFFECPSGSYYAHACKHISDNHEACGPDCNVCSEGAVCENGTCCLPPGASCDGKQGACCAGIGSCGPGFICG